MKNLAPHLTIFKKVAEEEEKLRLEVNVLHAQ